MAGLSNLQSALVGLAGGAGGEAQNMENERFTAGLQAQIKQAYLNALLQRAREQNATKENVATTAAAGTVAASTNKGVNAAIVGAGGRTTDTNLRDASQTGIANIRAGAQGQRQAAGGNARESAAINKAREDALSAYFPNVTKGQMPATVPWDAAQQANSSMAQNLGALGYSNIAPYFVSQTAQPGLWDRLSRRQPSPMGVVNPKFPAQLNALGAAAAGTQGASAMPPPGTPAAPKVAAAVPGGGFSVQAAPKQNYDMNKGFINAQGAYQTF